MSMLRKFSLLAGLILLASLSAHAQGITDKLEVFGGYSYLHVTNPSFSTNGWEASGQYKFMDWLGGVADFDGHYGTIDGANSSTYTYLFGPQVSWPARVSPFAHVLFGGAHTSVGGAGDSSFALAVGGGFDTEIAPSIHWRIFQADYLPTYFFGGTQNNVRISTGIVIHF